MGGNNYSESPNTSETTETLEKPIRLLEQSELDRAAKQFESRGLNGQEDLVLELKNDASHLLARINRIPIPPENKDSGRLVALAKTSLEESVMWAVKAVSRG